MVKYTTFLFVQCRNGHCRFRSMYVPSVKRFFLVEAILSVLKRKRSWFCPGQLPVNNVIFYTELLHIFWRCTQRQLATSLATLFLTVLLHLNQRIIWLYYQVIACKIIPLKKKKSHLLQKVFVALSEDRRQRQYYLHFKRHCLCALSSFFVRCFYWVNTHRIENVFFFLLCCCIFVSKAGSTLIFMKSVET